MHLSDLSKIDLPARTGRSADGTALIVLVELYVTPAEFSHWLATIDVYFAGRQDKHQAFRAWIAKSAAADPTAAREILETEVQAAVEARLADPRLIDSHGRIVDLAVSDRAWLLV